jgi:hypothetical protein
LERIGEEAMLKPRLASVGALLAAICSMLLVAPQPANAGIARALTSQLGGAATPAYQRIGGFVTSLPTSSVDPADTSAVYTFLRGGDGALYMTHLSGGVSSPYLREGGLLTSLPFTVTDTDGVVDGTKAVYVFVRGGDGALYVGTIVDGVWQGFTGLGGFITSFPTATVTDSGVWVAVRGGDGGVYVNHLDTTGTWSGWSYFGGGTLTAPWVASNENVYLVGFDTRIYAHSLSGGSWFGPYFGPLSSGPVATPDATGSSAFFREGDGSLGLQHFTNGLATDGLVHLGGFLTSAPWEVSAPGGLMSVYVRGGDGGLYRRHFDGSAWDDWESLGGFLFAPAGSTQGVGPTSVIDGAGIEHTFVLGGDQALYTIADDATAPGLSTTERGGSGDAPPRGDAHGSFVDQYGVIRAA